MYSAIPTDSRHFLAREFANTTLPLQFGNEKRSFDGVEKPDDVAKVEEDLRHRKCGCRTKWLSSAFPPMRSSSFAKAYGKKFSLAARCNGRRALLGLSMVKACHLHNCGKQGSFVAVDRFTEGQRTAAAEIKCMFMNDLKQASVPHFVAPNLLSYWQSRTSSLVLWGAPSENRDRKERPAVGV